MNMNRLKISLALCGAILAGNVMSAAEPSFIRTASSSTPAFETDFTDAAEKTVNAVVCIKSFSSRQQNPYGMQGGYDPFGGMFDFFFGNPGGQQRQQPRQQQKKKSEPVQTGLGSGVIISEDGYIVTNNHVIDNADKLEVLLNDNSSYEARIVGTDEASDLALIKIDAKGLSPITFGDSESVKIGEWVLAVGNPFGFNSTVTAGIVSARPGHSGGALVNLNGELIGINSAIYSNTGSYSGFSFAIPTSIVKKVMADIRQYGTVQRAMLGCSVVELDAKLAKEKGITAVKAGCLVKDVNDMSTAKELGLKEDDVITAINGVEVHNFAQLVEQISKFRPGDKISVTYCRDNKSYTKTGVLRNSQGNTAITKKGDFAELGCAFMKLSSETKQHLGISNGVQVQGLKGGAFRDAGVKDGFIITEINDVPVNNSDDVEYLYNQVMKDEDNEKVLFLKGVYPTGKKYYYAVNLESNE